MKLNKFREVQCDVDEMILEGKFQTRDSGDETDEGSRSHDHG